MTLGRQIGWMLMALRAGQGVTERFETHQGGHARMGPKVRPRGGASGCAITRKVLPNLGNFETMLGKEPFLQKTGGQSRQSPTEGSLDLTCTRFQPWRDSAMMDVTDGQTPPNTIKWFGPYFIAS